MKHMQGNWERGSSYGGTCMIKSETGYICEVHDAEKNAALIAAAPDLLEALDEVKDYFDVCDKNCIPIDLHKRIKAAIKKATELNK